MIPPIPFWSKAPFIRLLLPFIAGIIIQWHFSISWQVLITVWLCCTCLMLVFFLLPIKVKFRFSSFNGISACLLMATTGSVITNIHDIRNTSQWLGNNYNLNGLLSVTLDGPLVEKPNSFKATATARYIIQQNKCKPAAGNIILYFKKEQSTSRLTYGSQLVLKKMPLPIKNSGNPGSFNYTRYCLFQSITHQAYLTASDYILLETKNRHALQQFILNCRLFVLNILKKNIHGERELGLAEALLIGYKDDLDKNLVQAYTKTGVVHIIAISGMHLALIYGLLVWLTRPLKKINWLRTIIILCGLWLFTLMAGAQASVVRSCVMFTCLALGEFMKRKSSVYNTMALSAFLLLCYQPFWLWDVGFQLSYAAVLSIVVFYRKVYRWLFLPNKLLDAIWKTMAICMAAQIFTTPLSLFHFHQFPVLFLVTNLVAVPLSSVILFGEITMCAFFWCMPVVQLCGQAVELMIGWMNIYIERLEKVSFSVWYGFNISTLQVILIYISITSLTTWLIEKNKTAFSITLFAWLIVICLRSNDFISTSRQKKLIIYNIPKHRAVEFIYGRSVFFLCDPALPADQAAINFHLLPSRIIHRISNQNSCTGINDVNFLGRRIVILDNTLHISTVVKRTRTDLLVLSGISKNTITQLNNWFNIGQVIIDSSVPLWKASRWKSECVSLGLPCHDVADNGAFVMNL